MSPPDAPSDATRDERASAVPDVLFTTEPAEVLRVRVVGWITLSISVVCFGQALLIALNHAGVLPHPPTTRQPVLVALALVGLGGLSLFARREYRSTRLGPMSVVMGVLLALVGGWVVAQQTLDHAIPQVVWVPVLVAAAVGDVRFVVMVWVIEHVTLVAAHDSTMAFRNPSSWVNSLALLSLVGLLRWLHDAALRDATRAQERQVEALFRDELTGLPNRHAFEKSLSGHLARPGSGGAAVLRVDLEQFAPVTDTLGRATGDELLRRFADEVRHLMPRDAVVARVGADDFLCLLPAADAPQAERIAAEIVERFERPIDVGDRSVRLRVRVGVATVEAGAATDSESMLRAAEQAVARAKDAGRRRVASMPTLPTGGQVERYFRLSQDLHESVQRGELTVMYQPIVDLRAGRMRKAEALVRWTHRVLGLVSPGEFIPVAEANGAIHVIGDWVLAEAARQANAWRAAGARDFKVSVNRSPVQFRDDGDGRHPCLALLDRLGVPADVVELEITEGVLLDADDATADRLMRLRQAGVGLSLDDFGTGYSSIGQLHRIDLDVVKIDRRFVKGLEHNNKEYVLCGSIIGMAHSLGLEVVAEGIETEAQRALLCELGCDLGQGYLFSKPVSAEALGALLLAPQTPSREPVDARSSSRSSVAAAPTSEAVKRDA